MCRSCSCCLSLLCFLWAARSSLCWLFPVTADIVGIPTAVERASRQVCCWDVWFLPVLLSGLYRLHLIPGIRHQSEDQHHLCVMLSSHVSVWWCVPAVTLRGNIWLFLQQCKFNSIYQWFIWMKHSPQQLTLCFLMKLTHFNPELKNENCLSHGEILIPIFHFPCFKFNQIYLMSCHLSVIIFLLAAIFCKCKLNTSSICFMLQDLQ